MVKEKKNVRKAAPRSNSTKAEWQREVSFLWETQNRSAELQDNEQIKRGSPEFYERDAVAEQLGALLDLANRTDRSVKRDTARLEEELPRIRTTLALIERIAQLAGGVDSLKQIAKN